jgi:hypothetical protein
LAVAARRQQNRGRGGSAIVEHHQQIGERREPAQFLVRAMVPRHRRCRIDIVSALGGTLAYPKRG